MQYAGQTYTKRTYCMCIFKLKNPPLAYVEFGFKSRVHNDYFKKSLHCRSNNLQRIGYNNNELML